jgi:hypothetical protein
VPAVLRPFSAARALFNGAPNFERTDRLVQAIAAQYGMRKRWSIRRSRWSMPGSRSIERLPPDATAPHLDIRRDQAGRLPQRNQFGESGIVLAEMNLHARMLHCIMTVLGGSG